MSSKKWTWVTLNSQSRGAARLVMMVLAYLVNDDGVGFATLATIQKLANMDRRAVQLNIKRLEALGELVVVRGHPSGAYNCYQIMTDTKGGSPHA